MSSRWRHTTRPVGCLSFLLSLLGFAACSTQPGTILNPFSLGGSAAVTTDSRQRVVLSNQLLQSTSRPGQANPEHIVCAEPSPDVAVALANSFGSGISVFGYGSGSVSASQAEGIAQLGERTATDEDAAGGQAHL